MEGIVGITGNERKEDNGRTEMSGGCEWEDVGDVRTQYIHTYMRAHVYKHTSTYTNHDVPRYVHFLKVSYHCKFPVSRTTPCPLSLILQ